MEKLFELWRRLVSAISVEWLLTAQRPNGGDVIVGRAVVMAIFLGVLTLALRNIVDPGLSGPFSFTSLREQVVEIAPWFAGAVGATYAALYAKFSAQWSYLASLYNQIKQSELEMLGMDSESQDEAKAKLSEWKAGYIEDAQDLHLHTKANVSAIIYHWGKNQAVEQAFVAATPGGRPRWVKLYAEASEAQIRAAQKYAN